MKTMFLILSVFLLCLSYYDFVIIGDKIDGLYSACLAIFSILVYKIEEDKQK